MKVQLFQKKRDRERERERVGILTKFNKRGESNIFGIWLQFHSDFNPCLIGSFINDIICEGFSELNCVTSIFFSQLTCYAENRLTLKKRSVNMFYQSEYNFSTNELNNNKNSLKLPRIGFENCF